MEAIVVSHETLPGAVRINDGRLARGFAPLCIIVVPVIGSRDPKHKLSSTQLRAEDAAANAATARPLASVL
jgi:phosphopantetheine adenylyltransferase